MLQIAQMLISLIFPDTTTYLDIESYFLLFCVNTGVSDFTLTADSATLSAWAAEWHCDATCTSRNATYAGTNGFKFYYTDEGEVVTSHDPNQYSFPAMTEQTSVLISNTHNDDAASVTASATGVTSSQLADLNMPSGSQTFYYQCYGLANGTASAAAGGTSNVGGSFTTIEGNSTVTVTASTTSQASTGGMALAIAGALVWSAF